MNTDLVAIISQAARMGANEAIKALKPSADRISQRTAEKDYGKAFIRDNAARLSVVFNGNRKEYSRAELEQVKAARNVATLAMKIENNLLNK